MFEKIFLNFEGEQTKSQESPVLKTRAELFKAGLR